MANATSEQLQQLYIAYFGRPADPTGLDYWVDQGTTTKAFAANMYLQPEFISVNGSLSIQEQLNNIYQNLFNRDGDAVGIDYWTKEIQTGKLVLASIANDLIYAVNNSTGGTEEEILQRSNDLDCLSNRTAAATAYTAEIKKTAECILAYWPESLDPWIPGRNIEKGKLFIKSIGWETIYSARPAIPEYFILDEWLPCNGGGVSVGIVNPLIQSESNQISNDDCGCNKELETLSIEDGLYSSLGNSYVDNSLEDHSPYGLGPSNNIAMESLVSVDNALF